MEFKERDIVYSSGRHSTFMLQSRERSGSQWYCYLVDNVTHKVVMQDNEPIDCYAWEYSFKLVKNE